MQYNFEKVVDRSNNFSSKWSELELKFGTSDLLPMWVADMDFKSPDQVIRAIIQRAEQGIYGYTTRPESYNEAIKKWLMRRHNWSVNKEWLAFSPGVVPALSFILKAFAKDGDKILIQSPVYYPFYEVINKCGCKIIDNPLIINNDKYFMDLKDFEKKIIDNEVKMFILCSPHNPVGRVWLKEELEQLGEICIRNNVTIISDEIHFDLVFKGNKHIPFASISEKFAQNSITCIAPSKTFNLAGLQTSTIIIPNKEYFCKYNEVLETYHLLRNNVFGLVATEAAYNYGEEWLDQLLIYLEDNLNYTIKYIEEEIPKLNVIKPEGTYLVWIDCRKLNLDNDELNNLMIDKAKVALDDGQWFGKNGEGFQRINIACSRSVLKKCLERIKNAINETESIWD